MAVSNGYDRDMLELPVAIENALQRVSDHHGLLLRHERMWQAEVIGSLAAIVHLAVAHIAQANAVAEDVERAGVAVLGCWSGVGSGVGIVEVDTRFIAGAGVVHILEDQVGAVEVLAMQMVARKCEAVRPVAA